jgi:hypothetical protein
MPYFRGSRDRRQITYTKSYTDGREWQPAVAASCTELNPRLSAI